MILVKRELIIPSVISLSAKDFVTGKPGAQSASSASELAQDV